MSSGMVTSAESAMSTTATRHQMSTIIAGASINHQRTERV